MDEVTTGVAIEQVCAVVAVDGVVVVAAKDGVVARAAVDAVEASLAKDQVIVIIAADGVVDQVDRADGGLPPVALDVDEVVGAHVEHALARVGPTGSDDVGAGPAGELHRHCPNAAAGAVDDHRLAGLEPAVVEQRLP